MTPTLPLPLAALRSPLTLCALLMSSGCDFINSASELTFGEPDVPALTQEMLYPSVNELTGINEESEVVPGLPTNLSESTMAHLVGALGAQGECAQVVDLDGLSSNIRYAYFELSACTEDERCADTCPDDFYGLNARVQLEMLVLESKKAQELTQLLSEDSADAITQIRLQIKELLFFQGEPEARVSTNHNIEQFELWLGAPDVEPVQLLAPEDLDRISRTAARSEGREFERYEIPRNSAVAQTLISDILGGRDVILSVDLRFRIPREALYTMDISPAGVSQVIQPEIVVNAIKAATSSL